MTEHVAFSGLFFAALMAATVLPMQSGAVLAGLLLTTDCPAWALVSAASLGNVLGSLVNWLLGRGIHRFHDRKWLPVKPAALARAGSWYRRYGKWSLLLSWAPVIGDPLTVIAGVLREPLPRFLLLVTVAKVTSYIVLAAITFGLG